MKPRQYTLSELFGAFPIVQTHLATRMNISRALLVHYCSGFKRPSAERLLSIETELHNLGAELMRVELVTPEYRIGFEEGMRRMAQPLNPPKPKKARYVPRPKKKKAKPRPRKKH